MTSSDKAESVLLEENKSCDKVSHRKPAVKYGELVILGCNGSLPCGNRGRRQSKFVLYQRVTANGVKHTKHYTTESSHHQAIMDPKKHLISYSLSDNQTFTVEYTLDEESDMFQIGRSADPAIDFVLINTIPEEKGGDGKVLASSVSRFALRILANRSNPKIIRIYASGFDSSRNIYIANRTIKWQKDRQIDGLTTNGVLIWNPRGTFCGGEAKPGLWREVSVEGRIYSIRQSRSAEQWGEEIEDETNVLQDGTLIDLCGATLLWRSAEALESSPTKHTLETLVDTLNAGRPQCPVGLNTLVIPRKLTSLKDSGNGKQQPYVYLNCGHVQGHHDWREQGQESDPKSRKCPICLQMSFVVKLRMGIEPAFYVDIGPLTHAFNPCGHMTTEKTVKFWAKVPVPHGINSFDAVCPFCVTPLSDSPGYVRLIFQDHLD